MAITVNFRTQQGNVTSRQFQKNEGVSVYGKLTGMAGVGEPGTHIRMEIIDSRNKSIFFDEDNANLYGDYNFWFHTGFKDERLTIILTATYSIAGQDKVTIPIGIGNVNASRAPSPQTEGNWLSYIPILIIGAGTIYLIKMINE